MKILYRIADFGYKKEKPNYINNRECLKNATDVFCFDCEWTVIADNVSQETTAMILGFQSNIEHVSVGHGAGTFNLALDKALSFDDDEIVYFLENDYLHLDGSVEAIQEGLSFGDYATLYDHPDKYWEPMFGGNPLCHGASEKTRVYCGKQSHWKITNSTTMTFASRVKTLKEDEDILRRWTQGSHPHDFEMFVDLTDKGRTLVSPIPSLSTHGETKFLAPLINWNQTTRTLL